jgi:hypothetical protein
MDIGFVLSRAWQIIWKHKILWVFGILASCSSTNYGTSNYRASYQGEISPNLQYTFSQIPEWQIAVIVGIAILVILLLVVIGIFLGTMGRIGLIRGTLQAEQGSSKLLFGELFSGGLPYFWRVFGVNLLIGLGLAVLFILFGIFALIGAVLTLGIGLICLIPLFCLLIPFSWLVSVFLEQVDIAIVVEDLGIMDGLQRGWDVVKANLGMIIVMGLILYVGVGLIGGFIIGIPIAAIIAPAVIGAINGAQRALQGGLIITGLCLIVYIPVAIVLYGILQSYIKTAWTLTYLRLTSHPAAIQPAESATI